MPGFLRRFTFLPSVEVIKQIEGTVIVDLAPPDPATGQGSGTVLLVGEFEDGFFATDPEVKGAVEVFGSEDMRQKFGSFGYTYDNTPSENPSARRHLQELWNGNGFLKAFKLSAQRLLVSRVDTSVGQVAFDPLACVSGGEGPFAVSVGQTLSVTTDQGTGATAAIAGAVALVEGAAQAFATILAGETFGIKIDGGPQVNVTFGGADIDQASVIARINNTLGATIAIDGGVGELDFQGVIVGTGGSIELIEVTAGVLAKLGHAAGTTAGTGTFANINAVLVSELVTWINGTAAITTVNGLASIGASGELRVCNDTPGATSTVQIDVGALATILGFDPIGSAVGPDDHAGGTIPAGTRVRNAGGDEWVTMQTLDIPASEVGPYLAKVRPATDDGSGLAALANTVNVLADAIGFASLVVTNGTPLTAALTENQIDVAYKAALDATLDESGVCREANYLLSARRSDQVVRDGRANVIKATECGLFARKFITGDALGTTVTEIVANVAAFRHERVFYTGKGLKVTVPQIAVRGTAGGLGFSSDGTITVRPDGPLTTLCARLAPEENPGQATGLIDDFFEVDSFGEVLDIDAYKAFKAAGVAVPKVERGEGTTFQSGVTSSLESGRTTMARRKMADFLQDSAAEIARPFVKELSRQARRDSLRGRWEGFLADLQNVGNPAASRIEGFVVDDSVNAGNTPEILAQNIYFIQTTVRTYGSLDHIVMQTEIGPNAVITNLL